MKTSKREYEAPRIIDQGSAITKTAAVNSGSCFDGDTVILEYHNCECSGVGTSCKADQE